MRIQNYSTHSIHRGRGRIRSFLMGSFVVATIFFVMKIEVLRLEGQIIQAAQAAPVAPQKIDCVFKIDPLISNLMEE